MAWDYESMLDDKRCPICGHVGMLPNGGFDYECSECGYEGTFLDEDDEDDEDEEDDD